MRDGEVVQEFPVQVVKEQIAKPQTIEWIQRILREVVSEGLGKKAGSDKFDYLKDYCELVYLDRTEGVSTSQIKEELGLTWTGPKNGVPSAEPQK